MDKSQNSVQKLLKVTFSLQAQLPVWSEVASGRFCRPVEDSRIGCVPGMTWKMPVNKHSSTAWSTLLFPVHTVTLPTALGLQPTIRS